MKLKNARLLTYPINAHVIGRNKFGSTARWVTVLGRLKDGKWFGYGEGYAGVLYWDSLSGCCSNALPKPLKSFDLSHRDLARLELGDFNE